jgi:hypothetical protein
MGESSTSGDIVRGAEHRLQAVPLRREGYRHVDIGVQVGISRQRAPPARQRRVAAVAGQPSEATEDVRRLDLDHLDAMTLALLTQDKRGDAAIGAC